MRRRSTKPAPISPTPTATATYVLKPVCGSVPDCVVPVPVLVPADEVELRVPVEPVEEATVPDELEPEDVDPEELEPDELDEPDEPEEPLELPLPPPPLLFRPLSGSTYCWSPADGPLASAATGASSPTANATSSADERDSAQSHAASIASLEAGRVQYPRTGTSDPGAVTPSLQTRVLQDLLQR